MNDNIEVIAKTVEEATNEALRQLKATIDEVEITILDSGVKGFIGIGSRPAKILVKKLFNPVTAATTFLADFFDAMGMQVEVIATLLNEKQLNIELKGEKMGILIGKRGQTLDALQYIVNIVVNKGEGRYVSINIDTEDYRKRRTETLESLAVNLAKKAKHIRKNVVLEPMSPYERRVIHAVLQSDRYVTTYSEGNEPYRYVVISPK